MKRTSIALSLVATLITGSAYADEAGDQAIKARQSLMQLYAFNVGALGAMAKGTVEYDADTAMAYAENMVFLSTLSQNGMWPSGTDIASYPATAAKPEIWSMYPDIQEKAQALAVASTALSAAAGMDLASLQGAMGAVGGACGACHKVYREKK